PPQERPDLAAPAGPGAAPPRSATRPAVRRTGPAGWSRCVRRSPPHVGAGWHGSPARCGAPGGAARPPARSRPVRTHAAATPSPVLAGAGTPHGSARSPPAHSGGSADAAARHRSAAPACAGSHSAAAYGHRSPGRAAAPDAAHAPDPVGLAPTIWPSRASKSRQNTTPSTHAPASFADLAKKPLDRVLSEQVLQPLGLKDTV